MIMSSIWHILAGLKRPDNVSTIDQIIQPCHHAQKIQGNAILVSPSQHLEEIPEELSFVNFKDFNKMP